MANMKLLTKLRADREEAAIELHMDDEPYAHIKFDAAGVEHVIRDLSNIRRNMVDEVPHELEPGQQVEGIVDPVWRVMKQEDGTNHLLLRHPGLGWLAFVIPVEEGKHMGMTLMPTPTTKPQ